MSLFGAERIGCPEVLASLVFIIEDAIEQVEPRYVYRFYRFTRPDALPLGNY
jgi:hypothetical protein